MRPHRRYSEEEKKVLLATVARAQEQSAQPLSWILAELGLTRSVYYDWLERGSPEREEAQREIKELGGTK